MGVTCTVVLEPNASFVSRVTDLALPTSKLLGSIPPDLGFLQHLRHLDLSNNFLNGTLPPSLFNASELQTLCLSNNEVSGYLPELVGNLQSLQYLNLSDNALTGNVPVNLFSLANLSVLSLSNNYFYGTIPSGDFGSLQVLDLSSNLINGSLPRDFAGGSLRCLNLSYNRLSGGILPEFGDGAPANVTLDLSSNFFTGEIPQTGVFLNQKADSFSGNPDLCGKPLKNPCSIPSTLSTSPNVSTSPLAIAAIPKTLGGSGGDSAGAGNGTQNTQMKEGGLRPGSIVGIVVGDLVGIAIVSIFFLYLYQVRKKKKQKQQQQTENQGTVEKVVNGVLDSPPGAFGCSCLTNNQGRKSNNVEEETSETATETEAEGDESGVARGEHQEDKGKCNLQQQKGGKLMMVDGESELELESLLKASAYIVGATGSNIVYRAVMEDGTTFAVRRIGESRLENMRDFENQVRFMAKLRHPNLLRVRGFYWGADDKLVIYDYAPNGNLASASTKKQVPSPSHLSWDVRLRIARGVARGLTYLHEKKHVHGNLKPSNILLRDDMEPMIGDFGLDRLVLGDSTSKGTSSSAVGSNRSSLSRDNVQDVPSTGAGPTVSTRCASPYHAPESLKNLKPSPKWDVYSFGIILLELLSGKVFSDRDLNNSGSKSEWSVISSGDKNQALKMVDVALRDDMEGKENVFLLCFKLGFNCTSVTPHKRPSMKEAIQILEKIP